MQNYFTDTLTLVKVVKRIGEIGRKVNNAENQKNVCCGISFYECK